MEVYERSFIANMKELLKEGRDFSKIARVTLVDVMGEGPTSVLLSKEGGAILATPALFARHMSKVFGPGAVSVFKAIESNAAMSFADFLSTFELRTRPDERLGTTGIRPTYYLHDQRMKDELDEYRERRARALKVSTKSKSQMSAPLSLGDNLRSSY